MFVLVSTGIYDLNFARQESFMKYVKKLKTCLTLHTFSKYLSHVLQDILGSYGGAPIQISRAFHPHGVGKSNLPYIF